MTNVTSHEAQMHLHTFETDGTFDVVFLDFGEPGDLPDGIGTRKILQACNAPPDLRQPRKL